MKKIFFLFIVVGLFSACISSNTTSDIPTITAQEQSASVIDESNLPPWKRSNPVTTKEQQNSTVNESNLPPWKK